MRSSHTKAKWTLTTAIACISLLCISVGSAIAASTWLSAVTDLDVPTRIAVDDKGNIYVTEPRKKNHVRVYDRQGRLIKTLRGLDKPIGIAVDSQSRIYVGNDGNGSVAVYNADLTLSHRLGRGAGEFTKPNSIAVGTNGLVYVADSKVHSIKVYNQDGTSAFTFGAWGKEDGTFNFPIGLAIDEARGELYVTDLGIFDDPENGETAGGRVQAFDLTGAFKRSFGEYGTGDGKIIRPLGIAVDGSSKVYVTDGFQGVVHVFDAFGAPVETVYNLEHQMKTPIGVAVSKDNRLYIASTNTATVEVYGLDGHTTIDLLPASLVYEAVAGAGNPASQTITITNNGTGTLEWTAASDKPWLSLSLAKGVAGPSSSSSLTLNVASTRLPVGTYTGAVTLSDALSAAKTLPVTLTVSPPPAVLTVTPASLTFTLQQNGTVSSQSLNIHNTGGGTMTWTAASTDPWLTLAASGSIAPGSATVSLLGASLTPGTHSGSITISADGAVGSPATIPVSVTVIYAGTVNVTANIVQAGYDISGPATYSGSGSQWSSAEVVPGEYTIAFKPVAGYVKPQKQTFTVTTGKETLVAGEYRKTAGATHIIAGSGKGKKATVVVLSLQGNQEAFFQPFNSAKDIRVAAGDLDASGIDKIVVTDGKRTIKVYTKDGTELASYELPKGHKHARIAAADLDNDGRAEIIVGAENDVDSKKKRLRAIQILTYASGTLTASDILTAEGKEEFTLALGDVNGDGIPDLLIADEDSVQAFAVEPGEAGRTLAKLWSHEEDFDDVPEIAVGDIDGDGTSEIALSIEQERKNEKGNKKGDKKKGKKEGDDEKNKKNKAGVIRILRGTGEATGTTIEAFQGLGFEGPCTVAMGDIDGDGKAEIIAGAGREEDNDPLIRVYKGDGTYTGTSIKAMDTQTGVTVGCGTFQ